MLYPVLTRLFYFMKDKFIVSYEIASQLKEKGFNESCNYCYDDRDSDSPVLRWADVMRESTNEDWDYYCQEWKQYGNKEPHIIAAPTVLEVLDWLDEKDIIITLHYNHEYEMWSYNINGEQSSLYVYGERIFALHNAIKEILDKNLL